MLTTDNLQTAGVPYLGEWFGYWAMHADTFLALHARLSRMDVGQHLREVRADAAGGGRAAAVDARRDDPGAARAENGTQHVRRGYSYEVVDGIAIVAALVRLL